MAERCFAVLKAGHNSNICGRESNRDEVQVLKEQIPQELQYSAVYWLDHLSQSLAGGSSNGKLILDACEFLNNGGLLYILDVLNLVSEFKAAVQVLRKISDVITKVRQLTHQPEVELFSRVRLLIIGEVSCFLPALLVLPTLIYVSCYV